MIESRVRELAEAAGVKSAEELRRRVDVSRASAIRLWRGVAVVFHVETLDKLCEVLKCQPGDLLRYRAEG